MDGFAILNSRIYFSTRGNFSVPGISGNDEQIVVFNPSSLGDATAGSYDALPHFDALSNGIRGLDVRIVPDLGTSALEFSGGEDVMELASSADIDLESIADKSISLWFQPTSLSGRQVLYQQGRNNRGLNIYIENGSIYAGGWNAAVGWDGTWLSSANITQNAWNHVIFIYDADVGEVQLHMNGDAPLVGAASAMTGHGQATLGSARGGSRYKNGPGSALSWLRNSYTGLIDDVRVYDRALTDEETVLLASASPI